MSEEKTAAVEIDVRGAERAANAARQALQPWIDYSGKARSAFGEFSRAAGQAMAGIISDFGRAVNSAAALNLEGAKSQVDSLSQKTSQLAAAGSQNFETLQAKIQQVSIATKRSQEEIQSYLSSYGAGSYDFSASTKQIEALSAFARETNRSLAETAGTGAAFKRMGIDADKALSQIRAQATALKSEGGIGALTDQVAALDSAFAKSSNSAGTLIALTARLGKGLGPQQAGEVQQSVVGDLTANARAYQYHWQRTGRLGKGESIIDPRTGKIDLAKAAGLLQADLRSQAHGGDIAMGRLGLQAGAQFMNADLSGLGGIEGAASAVNAAYAATPGGVKDANEALKQINLQESLGPNSTIGKRRTALEEAMSRNPRAVSIGSAIGGTAGSLVPDVIGALLPKRLADTLTAPASAYLGEHGAYLGAAAADAGASAYEWAVNRAKYGPGAASKAADAKNAAIGARATSANRTTGQQAILENEAIARGGGNPLATFREGMKVGLTADAAETLARAIADKMNQRPIEVIDRTSEGIDVNQPGGEQ